MPWWERPLDLLRGRFATGAAPTPEQQPGSRAPRPASPDAWSEVPPLQRTLADPIRPVAINDQFRGSLASFTDPSFLTPLSHQVDPSVGGLVAGLVSPGQPQAHGGPELVLPPRGPSPTKPRVQRLASWSSSGDTLQTVPLEYRDQSGDGPDPTPEAAADSPATGPSTPAGPPVPAPFDGREPVPVPFDKGIPLQRSAAGIDDEPATIVPELPVTLPGTAESTTAAPPDVPTLGERPVPAPLFPRTQPLVTSTPREPAVQRIRYVPLANQPHPTGAPRTAVPTVRSDRIVETPVQRSAPSGPVTVQPLDERPSPGHPSHRSPTPTTRGSEAFETPPIVRAPGIPDSELPTALEPAGTEIEPGWPELTVSRLAESDPPATQPEEPGYIEAPLVVAWNQTAPTSPATVPGLDGPDPGGLTAARFADAAPTRVAGFEPATRVAAPIVAVQRRAVQADSPTARPELPVQAEHADAPSRSPLQPPLVVAPGPGARSLGDAFAPPAIREMSFERMFSGSSRAPTASNPAEDNTAVQREAVAAPTAAEPSVQTEAGDTAATAAVANGAPGSAVAAGLAGSGGNLDEMARRLYEPLAARLREELWLDRERAGLMNDV